METKKTDLPIWIQTFEEIIDWKYIYVDKTKEALEVINDFKYVFLSRPRRFWKSLFLDTLRNIFEWKKELFKWLYIYDKHDWTKKHPVIKIDFYWNLRSSDSINASILKTLKNNQERLWIKCEIFSKDYNVSTCFWDLIKKTYEKYGEKVVILIDEYDKAILDNLDVENVAKEAREILRWFYSIIKWNDEYIRFAFLTGVSKFSKASIFSWLNMLTDISLIEKYWNVCGITQEELEKNFDKYIKKWEEEKNLKLSEIKKWYNWYNFLKDKVYNPFNLLKFFANNFEFDNYWFTSWTPAFLIKLLEKQKYFLPDLSNLKVWKELLDSFDIEKIKLEVILYQAGYLTIKEKIINEEWEQEYKLIFPNKEVRMSLNKLFIDYFTNEINLTQRSAINRWLKAGDAEKFIEELKKLFSSIPYNNYTKNNITHFEWFYASLVYVYLQSLGYEIIWEDVTNRWRIDLTVILDNKIYLIEFKMSSFKESPLEQIKKNKYYEKYINSPINFDFQEEKNKQQKYKNIYLIWIIFDEEKRNIIEFEKEEIKN